MEYVSLIHYFIICPAVFCALLVGFYDGFYEPGTGTFLLILITVLFIKIIYELIVARVGL